jgi:hypothetical protein
LKNSKFCLFNNPRGQFLCDHLQLQAM